MMRTGRSELVWNKHRRCKNRIDWQTSLEVLRQSIAVCMAGSGDSNNDTKIWWLLCAPCSPLSWPHYLSSVVFSINSDSYLLNSKTIRLALIEPTQITQLFGINSFEQSVWIHRTFSHIEPITVAWKMGNKGRLGLVIHSIIVGEWDQRISHKFRE